MTKIKLVDMTIRNFKGIKDYELEADGNDLNIFGDNGTGKTPLYDAFLFCLFGKDSRDDTKFDWKPLDKNNDPVNHLETEVVVTLEVGSKKKKLGRMVEEKWTKKRGSLDATFDGHTTTYTLDDLDVKQKEFKAYLDGLIGEDTFKLLTNVSYFPEVMNWKERRNLLIDMVGDVSVDDILRENSELEAIRTLLDERDIDDNIQLVKQKKAQINKQIKDIPDRIDEVDRSLPDLSELDKGMLERQKDQAAKEIADIDTEINSVKNGNGVDKLRMDVRELRNEFNEKSLEFERNNSGTNKDLEESINSKKNEISDYSESLRTIKFDTDMNIRETEVVKQSIESIERENESNREKYQEIHKSQMEAFDEHLLACPTCKREFEQSQQEEMRQNHIEQEAKFNTNKSEQLLEIRDLGISNNKKVDELKVALEKHIAATEENKKSIDRINKEIVEAKEELSALEQQKLDEQNNRPKFEDSDEAKRINEAIRDIEELIANEKDGFQEVIEGLEAKKKGFQEAIDTVNDMLYRFELYDRQSKRKDELITEEQQLSVRFGELEEQEFLLEEFVKTKVSLLTDTINSRFSFVKFKLFDTAINGGLIEVCEPTVDGANYSSGLNNAARINAGLDIITTLSHEYDIYPPIFIDNAESVNELFSADAQMITLSVSNHKNLRVEVA